jgi:23S rRNA maturation-related 3'-5' exoribonuclease YhaM
MDKVAILRNELDFINDGLLREFVEYCVDEAPDYFFTMPASTTGKFHPAYTLGEGGLIKHTKAAVKIAHDLLNLEQNKHLNADQIITALILHDSIKKGNNGSNYTVTEHPLYAADFIGRKIDEFEVEYEVDCEELEDLRLEVAHIQRLIKSHMGQWNSDYRLAKEILPKPVEEDEKFVHTCDYLASRKYLTCEVE